MKKLLHAIGTKIRTPRVSVYTLTGVCALIALLLWQETAPVAAQIHTFLPQQRYPILGPCTGFDEPDLYRVDKDELIAASLRDEDVTDIITQRYKDRTRRLLRPEDPNAQVCSADAGSVFRPPSRDLRELAEMLPPWEDEYDKDRLKQDDLTAVLLEHLRTYRCALAERALTLEEEVAGDLSRVSGDLRVNHSVVFVEYLEEKIKMQRNFLEAERILARGVSFLGGYGRLRTLEAEITCLQRASLNARNAFALGAEASSCLPRVWDARDVLRDDFDSDDDE